MTRTPSLLRARRRCNHFTPTRPLGNVCESAQLGQDKMKFTYDTETDSISCPDLDAQQTASLQALLSRSLYRNDPVQDVAKLLLESAKKAQS
jgi:hypothetical protein